MTTNSSWLQLDSQRKQHPVAPMSFYLKAAVNTASGLSNGDFVRIRKLDIGEHVFAGSIRTAANIGANCNVALVVQNDTGATNTYLSLATVQNTANSVVQSFQDVANTTNVRYLGFYLTGTAGIGANANVIISGLIAPTQDVVL